MSKTELNKIWVLTKVLSQMNLVEALELLMTQLGKTKNNKEFLDSMQKQL